ncbi:hypothetical protein IAE26_16870 [Delftia sp. S67]|uniref:hypothetical protein n=2 Tax=Delftia TaxID=80865 RepID=UPI0018FFA0DB|nr:MULTISPECIES: hypothetical protein [unclassified Delftia]MBK0115625.1 hypothetical protein [Delftia sp. S65]MBK0119518.1 hypothetical protein [Delftia sp. S67]MBK0130178.1 hypothetical protein [Delftia sp. S66]
MSGFLVIPMSWVDELTGVVPGLTPAQLEQLRRGEVVGVSGLSIVAQGHMPSIKVPPPPIDRASHLAELRRHLRHGWRAR